MLNALEGKPYQNDLTTHSQCQGINSGYHENSFTQVSQNDAVG